MTLEKLKSLEPLFGSWHIDSVVAQGKSSVVYRGVRMEMGKEAYSAIKTSCFPKSKEEIDKAVASGKYKNAIQYLAALEKTITENLEKMMSLRMNSNIVRFDNYKIVKDENGFNVIVLMELLTPLNDYLSPTKMTRREVAKMGMDLCNALEGFRKCAIIHREIKPENIFVDSAGNYKLGDFGISTFSDSNTYTGDNLTYIAPEIYKESAVDYCSDIYSLGMLMYRFVNDNRMPFLPAHPAVITDSDRENAFSKRMNGEVLLKPALADIELSKLIFKAAAFRPQDRFRDPKTLYDALEGYILQHSKDYSPAPAASATKGQKIKVTATGIYTVSHEDDEDKDSDDEDSFVPLNELVEEKKPDSGMNKGILLLAVVIIIAVSSLLVLKNTLFNEPETQAPPSVLTTASRQPSTTEPSSTAPTTEPTVPSSEPLTLPTRDLNTTETQTTIVPSVSFSSDFTTDPFAISSTGTTDSIASGLFSSAFSFLGGILGGSSSSNKFVNSNFKDKDPAGDGKQYAAIKRTSATHQEQDGQLTGVTVTVNQDIGTNPKAKGKVYIIKCSGTTVLQSEQFNFDCISNDELGKSFVCEVLIDKKITFDQGCDYYICFDEGVIETESSVSLPFEIRLEK